MPILLNSVVFTDEFGNASSFYKSNAGDRITAAFNVSNVIRMTSQNNPLNLDPSLNQVTSASVSWIDEGFRVGDWVKVTRHSSGGGQIGPAAWTQVTSVDDITCDFTAMPFWYNIQQSQYIVLLAVTANASSTARSRDDLDVLLNHVKNSLPGSESSLIDAESTRAIFTGVSTMLVAATINGVLVNNQSGQFVESVNLTRNVADYNGWVNHTITCVFSNSGAYDENWFFISECLKLYMKLQWASYAGEPFARAEAIYNLQANTGWFNQAHNSSITDSTFTSGPSEIDYSVATTFDIVVEGPLTDIGIGSMYMPTDTLYYKNRPYPQQEITMLVPTQDASAPVTYTSNANESNASYTLEINSIITVVNTHTINVTITPNAAFDTFMGGREDGDRLFYLWVKCGNINHLAFADQLTVSPPVGGPITMVQDYGYLDHSENILTAVGDATGFVADTEDDVAYIGTFLLEKGVEYSSFSVRIEAFDTVTEEDFTLQQAVFNFAGVQISNAGVYLLNESIQITSELLTTSEKRFALFTLEPSLDTLTHYGVKIYAPWLLNWRSWQALPGASVDFYPTQNKNWEQYDNTGNWIIRTELELLHEGLAYTHDNQIVVEPYDNEPLITSTIELFLMPSLTPITAIPANEIIKVKSTHVKTTGAFDQGLTWGCLTVENFEQQPRYMISSVVDFDNNAQNPLNPLSGSLINILYPAADTAVLEGYLDSSKLQGSSASISAKIKERDKTVADYLITAPETALLGYSVFKIAHDSVYSGPLLRVRRKSDNVEQDIYADSNNLLDTTSLLAFTGSSVTDFGYVCKWYNQSGETIHAVQTNINKQPLIVSAGVLITDAAGLPSMQFDGVDDQFELTSAVSTKQECLHSFVFGRSFAGLTPAFYSISLGAGGGHPYAFQWTNGIVMDGFGNIGPNNVHDTGNIDTGSFINVVWRDNLNEIRMSQNGVALTNVNEADAALQFRTIGSINGTNFHEGLMQEITYWQVGIDASLATLVQGSENYRFNIY